MNDNFFDNLHSIKQLVSDKVLREKLKGESMADILTEVCKLVKENDFFARDIITGNIRTNLDASGATLVSYKEASNLFYTYFVDRIRIKVGDKAPIQLTSKQADVLFDDMLKLCTFNSRKEMYENIPEWDGVPRITDFMQKYFKCRTLPQFFWLFMTGIVGMMKNPEECYVPYWFDFVGAKGVGKSLLLQKLVGVEHVCYLKPHARPDDVYVDMYKSNALISCDDEAKLIGKQYSYDEWKEFTSLRQDIFSCKYGQPEIHYRSSLICRTANNVKTVFSTTERRQIIFESHNEANHCPILLLPDDFWSQMLAEAKQYYEQNGLFPIEENEKKAIMQQNIEHTDITTVECLNIFEFIEELKEHTTYREERRTSPYVWSSWRKYKKWMEDNRKHIKGFTSATFWDSAQKIALVDGCIDCSEYFVYRPTGHSCAIRLFKILSDEELKEREEQIAKQDSTMIIKEGNYD